METYQPTNHTSKMFQYYSKGRLTIFQAIVRKREAECDWEIVLEEISEQEIYCNINKTLIGQTMSIILFYQRYCHNISAGKHFLRTYFWKTSRNTFNPTIHHKSLMYPQNIYQISPISSITIRISISSLCPHCNPRKKGQCEKYNESQCSCDVEQPKESRLKPTFRLDLLKASIELIPPMVARTGGLGMDEIAPLTIHAGALRQEDATFFGLVATIRLLIFLELMRAMGELTLLLIGTEAKFNKFFTELRFFLILLYGRFAIGDLLVVPRGGRVLSRGGIVELLLGLEGWSSIEGQLQGSSSDHANLICKLFQ